MKENEAIWVEQNEANVLMTKIVRFIFLTNILIEGNIVYYQAGKFSKKFLLVYIWKKAFWRTWVWLYPVHIGWTHSIPRLLEIFWSFYWPTKITLSFGCLACSMKKFLKNISFKGSYLEIKSESSQFSSTLVVPF